MSMIFPGKNAGLPNLAPAWILSRGDDIVPILGTKRRGYLIGKRGGP
jgi:hypothetical protein